MNNRLRFVPPKQRLEMTSGVWRNATCSPFGAWTRTPLVSTPPQPQPHHTLPSVSQRMPSANPACVVLHRNQPTLVIARMPVRVSGLGLVRAHVAIILGPAQRAMVRDVTPDETAPVTHPNRAFAPERAIVAHAMPDALQRCVALLSLEALVRDLKRRLRVGDRSLAGPVAVAAELIRRRCQRCRCRGRSCDAGRCEEVASVHFHVLSSSTCPFCAFAWVAPISGTSCRHRPDSRLTPPFAVPLAQVGCHVSRSMRPRICPDRGRVKWLPASCRMRYRGHAPWELVLRTRR